MLTILDYLFVAISVIVIMYSAVRVSHYFGR
jgi:hypothetical protein